MSKIWLALDVNYLMHRAFHVFGGLSHGKHGGTGATYGVFRDIIRLQDIHNTSNVVFCFDHGKRLKRQEVCPGYKNKRHARKLEGTEEEAVTELRRQINLLKTEYLPYLGYENVFYQKGYEADDVIASVVQNTPTKDEVVIVSGDKDLYQLISARVCVWHPKSAQEQKCWTLESFTKEYGIHPQHWCHVKAIAGCSTDEVPGLRGVGEKTACKYLLKKATPRINDLVKLWMNEGGYFTSLDLVRLPYTGTQDFVPKNDQLNVKHWQKLTKRLGMKSLVNQYPVVRK
jgi:5'-3' exonuclease